MKDTLVLPSWITRVVSDNEKIQIVPVSADLLGYSYTISTTFKPTFGTVLGAKLYENFNFSVKCAVDIFNTVPITVDYYINSL